MNMHTREESQYWEIEHKLHDCLCQERPHHVQITFELIAADAVPGSGDVRFQNESSLLRHQRARFGITCDEQGAAFHLA